MMTFIGLCSIQFGDSSSPNPSVTRRPRRRTGATPSLQWSSLSTVLIRGQQPQTSLAPRMPPASAERSPGRDRRTPSPRIVALIAALVYLLLLRFQLRLAYTAADASSLESIAGVRGGGPVPQLSSGDRT